MAKLAHSMIRVLDEAASVKFYQDVFGLKIADRLDFEKFTLVYLRDATGEFEFELTVNKDRETPYDLGDGYGHIAFVVDDLEAARETAITAGATPRDIVDFRPAGETVAKFFFVADPDGYQIEVIEKGGRFT
ncbi:Lactoylglutathione lyase [Sulfitobacter indolifex]|uniref:Glyoxalase/bleomycin resistance protein/dioxygenase n=1 Tax=Sulfitobacter indolifex HEL-45 TaxID=391624 RepID=A0ABM9XBF4_9RHOB|nr:VOC family protein [Sulfitobacter indolifex]EDQ06871.1 Glyoxalase/bleomycin resistance protein/dioxygenase [Sulfitobacter indolifex HEL-45]UOA17853.1 Lactoylglutathione lyase [Sulfitobacter indolifex]